MSEAGSHPLAPIADSETLLRRVLDLIRQARPMPLSSSVMISREEIEELLQQAVGSLPDELQQARWMLKEREEFVARTRLEGDEIINQASARAEQMVQRQEVVRAAENKARRIIAEAETEARRLQHEVDDYCDQRLASFEIAIERVSGAVAEARGRLHLPQQQPEPEPEPVVDDSGFYDQDEA